LLDEALVRCHALPDHERVAEHDEVRVLRPGRAIRKAARIGHEFVAVVPGLDGATRVGRESESEFRIGLHVVRYLLGLVQDLQLWRRQQRIVRHAAAQPLERGQRKQQREAEADPEPPRRAPDPTR
jgi:hypothetical protein